MLLAQHGWLIPPQVVQVFVPWSHATPVGAVQVLMAQHGWSMPPHVAQVLLDSWQPKVALHLFSAQHGRPASPQGQTPFVQAPLPLHVATQVPPTESQQPPLQVLPAQHACPAAPH
jgi:hypothetical protein